MGFALDYVEGFFTGYIEGISMIQIYGQNGNLFEIYLKFSKLILMSFICGSCRHETGVRIMSF